MAAGPDFSYFSVQASWGVTKHFGGTRATKELCDLVHLDANKHLLEIGCGVGIANCFIAEEYGCRIVSVDLSPEMLAWAKRRAERRGVQGLIEFRQADAQALPFDDGQFDAVISESVTAFVPDQARAVREYARVCKVGGYVGLNEGTWMGETAPPAELAAYIDRNMQGAQFNKPLVWQHMLSEAGLQDLVTIARRLDMWKQRLDETSGLDWSDWVERLSAWKTFFGRSLREPAFRQYVKSIMPPRSVIRDLFRYLGYGLYVGAPSEWRGRRQ